MTPYSRQENSLCVNFPTQIKETASACSANNSRAHPPLQFLVGIQIADDFS
jgi:hypothetical protein